MYRGRERIWWEGEGVGNRRVQNMVWQDRQESIPEGQEEECESEAFNNGVGVGEKISRKSQTPGIREAPRSQWG